MDNHNSEWEVKEDKVRVGTEWKDAKALKRNFLVELLLAIVFGIFCIYAFTINILFGVTVLFISLFFVLISLGSISALHSLDESFAVKVKFNLGLKEKLMSAKKKIVSNIAKDTIKTDVLFTTSLTKTANAQRQAVISNLTVGELLAIENHQVLQNDAAEEIGELSKINITKLEAYAEKHANCTGFKAKVVSVEKNSADKFVVKVELLAVK